MTKRMFVRAIGFLLVLALCFGGTSHVLGYWDDNYAPTFFETFYELPRDTVDVAWVGPSTVQEFIIPAIFYKNSGVTLYDLTTAEMPLSATTFLMREAEKTQDPKLYLVDLRAVIFAADDANVRRVTDNMRLSANWVDAVQYMVNEMWDFHPKTRTDMLSHYIPFFLYHSRWNDLHKEDFIKADRIYFGFRLYTGRIQMDKAEAVRRMDSPPIEPAAENMTYLRDVLDFCDGFGKKVIFVNAPHMLAEWQFGMLNYAMQVVRDRGYEVWDLNREVDAIGLDYSADFYHVSHTNVWGAQKISRYVAQQLAKRYDLPDHRGDPRYQAWADELAHFEEDLAEAELRLTTDWDEYLDRLLLLDPEQYTIFMTVRGSQGKNLDRSAVEKLEALGFDGAETLLDGQNHAFVAIRAGGYRYQDISDGEGALTYNEMLHNQQVSLTSRTTNAGNSASIRLGTREYGKNRSGFNIVVEDVLDGELVDSVSFDLDAETVTASR